MKENRYDDPSFFTKYSRMPRSVNGLDSAGEWQALRKLLPDFTGKRVLDLGCGYGWHCIYAAEHGAKRVVGIDISEKMLAMAREKTVSRVVEYRRTPMEDAEFEKQSFDVVISSLAFHYAEDFSGLCKKVHRWLAHEGAFVFSVEHPVFTAEGAQQWMDDQDGNHLYWPVDRYFTEGRREAIFLGEPVVKYHRTMASYINGLLKNGFALTALVEPQPPEAFLSIPGMTDELRRPMMLLVAARKV